MAKGASVTKNSKSDRWQWLNFGSEVVYHCVPRELVQSIATDLEERGAPLESKENIASLYMDAGGFTIQNEPRETVRFSGLRLTTRSNDVSWLLGTLKSSKLRTAPDGKPYFKIHGFYGRCIVLTPKMKESLVGVLSKIEDAAESRAEAFYKAHEAWIAAGAVRA